jgi:pimeloyl-ACP methyl ester carboxylesterase
MERDQTFVCSKSTLSKPLGCLDKKLLFLLPAFYNKNKFNALGNNMGSAVEYTVESSCGRISILDNQGKGPAVVFIHGNSACKEIFKKQFDGSLGDKYRLIAIDLPGHGKSDDSTEPKKTYSLPGYADVAMDVLSKIDVQRATIVGWSLGGHIALDMLKRWPGTQGVLITGTPPIQLSAEGFKQGFRPFPCLHLMSQEKFSLEEAETFVAQGGISSKAAPFLLEATLRTHGLARSCLIGSMQAGTGGNQKETVETSTKPVAVVCGENDAGINNDYIQKDVDFKNLWDKQVQVLKGGHGVFWENTEKFNAILFRFLNDINGPKCASKKRSYLLIGTAVVIASLLGIGILKSCARTKS